MQAPEEYLRRFNPSDFGNDRLRYTNAAMLAVLDDAVGAILGKLRSLNLESNTVIFFTSDNGAPAPTGIDANGSVNTPLRGYKGGTMTDGAIRTIVDPAGTRTRSPSRRSTSVVASNRSSTCAVPEFSD